MISILSQRIADFLYTKNVLSKDKIEICKYGYEVLLFNMFNAVLVLGLGMILGKFQYSVLFFLVFASIRSYSGGYHAKNTLKCTIVYLTAFLLVLLLSTSDFIRALF